MIGTKRDWAVLMGEEVRIPSSPQGFVRVIGLPLGLRWVTLAEGKEQGPGGHNRGPAWVTAEEARRGP